MENLYPGMFDISTTSYLRVNNKSTPTEMLGISNSVLCL